MKSLLYIFRRYKVASVLNLLGIALALTGVYVLLTQIEYATSYNKGFGNYERLYRLDLFDDGDWSSTHSRPFLDELEKCPQIESIGYRGWPSQAFLEKDGTFITVLGYRDNGKMLQTFGAELLDGNFSDILKPNSVVIPESLALQYFGEAMVVGKEIVSKYGPRFNVVAVYKDFPENSEVQNHCFFYLEDENIDADENWNYTAYVKVRENASLEDLKNNINNIFAERYLDEDVVAEGNWQEEMRMELVPVSDTYFSNHYKVLDKGSKSGLLILRLAVALLLIVSIINFSNYSMALAPMRLRGIVTRKVMGESNISLVFKILGEAIAITSSAFLISLVFVALMCRFGALANSLSGSIKISDNPGLLCIVLLVSVLVAILSNIQSLRYYTSFQPVEALKGSMGHTGKGRRLKTWLVGLQFVASFVLAVIISLLYCQSSYIYSSDYGFRKDALITCDLMDSGVPRKEKGALRTELEKLTTVQSVAFSQMALGVEDNCMGWTRVKDDELIVFSTVCVDYKFFTTCGIEIVEGDDFKETDSDVCIINKAFLKQYPELIHIGQPLFADDFKVLGICRNFRTFTTRIDNQNEPVAFVIMGEKYSDWGDMCSSALIRIADGANPMEARRQVSEVLSKFSDGVTPEVKFIDDQLEAVYDEEMKFIRQVQTSALLILAITLIGVFCLTMFETEYRRKEIAIRKVMGSTVEEILALFVQRYAVPLAVSFVIAGPLAYYLGSQWLENFAERTPIHWWIFPLSFLAVSAVVVSTVLVQSYRVATENPINSVRTE